MFSIVLFAYHNFLRGIPPIFSKNKIHDNILSNTRYIFLSGNNKISRFEPTMKKYFEFSNQKYRFFSISLEKAFAFWDRRFNNSRWHTRKFS